MKTGNLRHKIIIQNPDNTISVDGKHTPVWTDYKTCFASISPLSNREQFEASQTHVTATHKINIRYLTGINEKQRIKFGDRYLYINSVVNKDERNIELEITASEKK